MSEIRWNQGFSVGVSAVDSQHKRLVALINTLSAMLSDRSGTDSAASVVKELKAYAVEHFATEERLMERHGYPGLEAHKGEHAKFVQAVQDHEARIAKRSGSTYDLWAFLQGWLLDHIMEVDLEMGRYLQERGES